MNCSDGGGRQRPWAASDSGEGAEGRARLCILGAECLKAVYTAFTTGVFLTGFLLYAGMDQVQIGLVTSLPLLAGVLYPSPLFCWRNAGGEKRCWEAPDCSIMGW